MTQHTGSRRPHSRRRALAPAACAGLLLATQAGQAHAFLDSATPRVGSTIRAAPAEVVLTFTQGVEAAFSKLEVTGPAGEHEEAGSAHIVGTASSKLAVGVGRLAPGTYTVIWHVMSVDTHGTQGRFQFTVAP